MVGGGDGGGGGGGGVMVGTLYYVCSEPVSGEPPFKVTNALSYREER